MRLEERIKNGHAYRFALETILYDTAIQASFMSFARFLAAWMLRLITPGHEYPQKPAVLPLPDTPPPEFSNLPEYFLEVTGEWFSFIGR